MNQPKPKKSESERKYEKIWQDHHDPKHREEILIKKRREQRILKKKKDYGL